MTETTISWVPLARRKAKGRYTKAKCAEVERLGKEGLTSVEIQDQLGIEKETWAIWSARYARFDEAASHAWKNDRRQQLLAQQKRRAQRAERLARQFPPLLVTSVPQTVKVEVVPYEPREGR